MRRLEVSNDELASGNSVIGIEGCMSNLNFGARAEVAVAKSMRKSPLQPVAKISPIQVAPTIRSLTPYEAVNSQAYVDARAAREEVFKLDWNESTIGPSPKVNDAILAALQGLRGLNWYPPLGGADLLQGLASYTALPGENLLVTNGSDDALALVCTSFLDRGDDVLVPVPTYNHFMVFAQSQGANVRTVQAADVFSKNLDGIRAAMTRKTRLLYLVSPNNPTGVVFEPADVEALCLEFPRTLVVLDEAYFEFSQVTGIALVERLPNLLVTRTFSKAFGLAGLRVGYLAADASILDGLRRVYNPKSVNSLAQIGAAAALTDLDYLHSYIAQVRVSKELLSQFFGSRNVEAYATAANFVVVRTGDLSRAMNLLEDQGVYVRDRSSYPGLDGCFRMTVGTVDQTRRLIERMSDIF